jgi:ketosteroid isomerase-like protein
MRGVSHESVELVRSLHPGPATDLARIYRDDLQWAAASALISPAFAPDFKCIAYGYIDAERKSLDGLAGLRHLWLEWLAPWQSYRVEIEELVDLGEDVLALVRDFGRRGGDAGEIAITSAALWTVRDGKVTQIVFYAQRDDALEALGLS